MHNLQALCKNLYGIYAITMLMQMVPQTVLPGALALIIAIIITYANRDKAKGTIHESHLRWMIRNFWIGGGVYMPILTLAGVGVVYSRIDLTKITDAIYAGQIADNEQMFSFLMSNYGPLMTTTLLATMGPFLAWWLWRCWKGYKALKDGKPIEDVTSWI